MTTFDGARTYPHPDDPNAPGAGPLGHSQTPPPTEPDAPFDAFEALREQLAERDEDDPNVTPVEIPGIGWRLICRTDFDYEKYKEWQKAALPRNQRNGRKINPLDMNQATLSYLVLLNTCESVEYRRDDDTWEPLAEDDGSPATLQSGAFLGRMGVVDPRLLVKRLFGKEGRLIAAGQKVVAEAGYGEESGGDGADPSV